MTKNPLVAALEETTAEAMASGKPLNQRLRMIADRVRTLSPEFASAVDAFVGRLVGAEAGATAPALGDRFPGFVLPDQAGRLVSLHTLLEGGPLIVAFLRGHWCPYCRLTAGALSEVAGKARALGANIVAITPEGRKFVRELDADTHGAFPILADVDNGFALSANLGIWVDQSMASLIAGAGWDVPAYQGNDAWILPIPAIFTLSRDGIVIARHVNPDYRERANLDDILGALSALA